METYTNARAQIISEKDGRSVYILGSGKTNVAIDNARVSWDRDQTYVTVTRRYLSDTNVVHTEWLCSGSSRVTRYVMRT